ncbi:gluconokinase [Salinisphaera dokdonensis]
MTHNVAGDSLGLTRSRRIVVMGVSGSGKSTLGEALGARLGVPYLDGDTYHPPANIEKMANGEALTDADRHGWLHTLADLIRSSREHDDSLLIGCSALKHRYREQLRGGDEDLTFVYLDGSYELILARMQARDHFFSPAMLKTQFETLEAPGDDEAIRVSIAPPLEGVVDTCVQRLIAGHGER